MICNEKLGFCCCEWCNPANRFLNLTDVVSKFSHTFVQEKTTCFIEAFQRAHRVTWHEGGKSVGLKFKVAQNWPKSGGK